MIQALDAVDTGCIFFCVTKEMLPLWWRRHGCHCFFLVCIFKFGIYSTKKKLHMYSYQRCICIPY